MSDNENDMPEQATQAMEIAPGLTVEEIKSMFFDVDALREPPYRIFQLNGDGHRYYYRFNEAGEPEFYPSVTTLIKQVMPTSPQLIDWLIANGKDASVEKRDMAAAYGTFMHAQFETLIINRRYDFDFAPEALLAYMRENNLPDKFFTENVSKIRKDVLAFAQFVQDYNIRPLAIEIGLVHPEFHYAGCVDMPCIMTDPKTGDDFRAIVDFKSGRKGFWEEHEIQLHLYKDMWNVNFPDMQIVRVFNFSPKDWRTKPTYKLKEQTNSVNAKKIPHLLNLAMIEDEKRDNTCTMIQGVLELDGEKSISDNILSLSLAELIKSKSVDVTPETEGVKIEKTEEASKLAVERTKYPKGVNVPEKGRKSSTSEKSQKLPENSVHEAKAKAANDLLNGEIEL